MMTTLQQFLTVTFLAVAIFISGEPLILPAPQGKIVFRLLAIGREQKMIELKKEINELLKEAGNAEKYKIH
jgi:hypothetical protein